MKKKLPNNNFRLNFAPHAHKDFATLWFSNLAVFILIALLGSTKEANFRTYW